MSESQKEYGTVNISPDGRFAYLPGVLAAVTFTDSSSILAPTDADPKPINIKGRKDMPKVVPWGEDNAFPQKLIDKVKLSPVMSANLFFNVSASFGEGIVPVVLIPEGKEKVAVPLFNAELYLLELIDKSADSVKPYYQNILNEVKASKAEIDLFYEQNDIDGYLLEVLTDLHWFFNNFPEIILNRETGDKQKIVRIRNKEAAFSRLSEMNKTTGQIEYHYYFGKWGDKQPSDNEPAYATPMLDYDSPVLDLRERVVKEKNQFSYIVPVCFPTPGRNYYQKPYWYSLIESGWYDFAITIPELKKYLIQNKTIVNYIIELDQDYFKDIFKDENITEEKDQVARIKKEYTDLNEFLTKKEHSGKSIVTFNKRGLDGKPTAKLTIKPVETKTDSGEYIEDSEEASNIMCYAMLVHPSLVGASPGKNANISGTEARELFLIKQAILKPIINRALRAMNVVKAFNKWSKHIEFVIPNIQLTTLDKNKTGVQSTLEDKK